MSAIICRSIVKHGRTNIVRMFRLDALRQCHHVIPASRHIHYQPKKPNSAPSRARGKSNSSRKKPILLPISAHIATCVENNKYDEALGLLHELQRDDNLEYIALKQVLRLLCTVKFDFANSSLFMTKLWDMLDDAVRRPVRAEMAIAFALSFDYADDIERMQQLANHMPQQSRSGQKWILALSVVASVLSRHHIVNESFQRCAARSCDSVPFDIMPMLCHRGAVFSLISRKQVDEAVDYLKSHAASLQISNSTWGLVIAALYGAGRSAENLPLYELWMSVLPPIDELKWRADYQEIMPSLSTYNMLLGCDSITPEFVLSQLDVFGLSLDAGVLNRCIRNAAENGDHKTALRLWGDLRKRGLAMSLSTMSALTDIIRYHSQQPDHLDGADRLAVMMWDTCHKTGDRFCVECYAPYMSAFRRLDDIKRILELAEKLQNEPPADIRLLDAGVVTDLLHMLKKHNQTVEYQTFVKMQVKWMATK